MDGFGGPPGTRQTPANTVRNATYSSTNRFSGPPGTTTPGGPPGSGGASQISRPALAAVAATQVPNIDWGFLNAGPPSTQAQAPPPGAVTPGGPPGTTGAAPQINPPSVPQPNTPQAAPTPEFDLTPYQPQIQQMVTSGYGLMPPSAQPSTTADMNMVAQAQQAGAGSYDRTVFSPQELMSAATSGAATAPAAQAVQQAAPPTPNELMGLRYTAAAKAYQDPATGYAQSQVAAPSPNELAGMRYQQAAKTYTEDPGAYQQMLNAPTYGSPGAMGWQPSQQELMRAATSGAATHPAAQRVQQAAPSFSQEDLMRAATSGAATHPAAQAVQQTSPYAGLDLTSRANSNARMVLPSADDQRAAIAAGGTAYTPEQTARVEQIQNNAAAAVPAPAPAPAPVPAPAPAPVPAAVPAWDPANNDAPITDPIGMWTDPTSGGQMPDPADAEAWERMQRVADSEFGPGQDIYNPTYDTERFPTYDPNDTGGGWPDTGGGDFGNGDFGAGPSADLGTYNPNSGEYLQFGLNLAQNTSDYNRVGEGREFWNQAQDRKWDEMRRGIPGQYNSRGMIDSGLLTRAEGLAAGDQRFETDVRQWSDNEERARLERERVNLYGGFEGGLTQGLMDNYMSGMLTYDDPLTAMNEAMGSGTGGYMRSGIMDRAIPTWGSGVGR